MKLHRTFFSTGCPTGAVCGRILAVAMTDLYLYNTAHHPKGPQRLPTFVARGEMVYTTPSHSDGEDPRAWYVIRDQKLYPTEHHPQRAGVSVPWYEVRGRSVYAAEGHPHGRQSVAWFDVKES